MGQRLAASLILMHSLFFCSVRFTKKLPFVSLGTKTVHVPETAIKTSYFYIFLYFKLHNLLELLELEILISNMTYIFHFFNPLEAIMFAKLHNFLMQKIEKIKNFKK